MPADPFWISAFLDVPASDHRAAEEFWAAVTDPGGSSYCVTDRDPRTGNLVRSATP